MSRFVGEVYGIIPPAPESIEIERQPIPLERVERIIIRLRLAVGTFTVDAGLWLPPAAGRPAPVIVGLDFKGPVGILSGEGFPLDPEARVAPVFEGEGRLTNALRHQHPSLPGRSVDRCRLCRPRQLLRIVGSRRSCAVRDPWSLPADRQFGSLRPSRRHCALGLGDIEAGGRR